MLSLFDSIYVCICPICHRSSFFEAKVKSWNGKEREIVLEKECDPEVLDIAVDYMYGIDIPDLVKIQTLHLKKHLNLHSRTGARWQRF